jgi:hypothetical protein
MSGPRRKSIGVNLHYDTKKSRFLRLRCARRRNDKTEIQGRTRWGPHPPLVIVRKWQDSRRFRDRNCAPGRFL